MNSKVILIEGNKYKKPEPDEHIIKFPGGSISVTRTSDNTYWAHIEVNQEEIDEDTHRESKAGQIIETRLDYRRTDESLGRTDTVFDTKNLNHVGVRIMTTDEL